MTQWHEKYIGIPFVNGGRSFAGCDCGGLILLMVQEERGIKALDMLDVYSLRDLHTRTGQAKLSEMIAESLAEWVPVSLTGSARPLDMALYRFNGLDCHCAAVVDARHIIHVEENRPSRLAPLKMVGTGYKLVGLYRHAKLS